MSRAVFQQNFIYGHCNLNFISFSHGMKYYSSFDIFPQPFKNGRTILRLRPIQKQVAGQIVD